MIYICDFFVNDKEGVSNQIKALSESIKGKIFSAGIFLGQKNLRWNDIKNNRYILPSILYKIILPLVILFSRDSIHHFEEEPSFFKRLCFNLLMRKRPLYITMYRRPTDAYVKHVLQYRNLSKIFVELNLHKKILLDSGVKADKIEVFRTPSIFKREKNSKLFIKDDISVVFASWNSKEKGHLKDRGIISLLNMVTSNQCHLTIVLRDDNTNELDEIIRDMGIENKVILVSPKSRDELLNIYKNSDFVAFIPEKRVTKDVPNSIIDGLALGKPAIVSSIIDVAKIVKEEGVGIVIDGGEVNLNIAPTTYDAWSQKAFEFSLSSEMDRYLKLTEKYE
jgi:glycosyltransferase involved in cell wall biosynthesis